VVLERKFCRFVGGMAWLPSVLSHPGGVLMKEGLGSLLPTEWRRSYPTAKLYLAS